MALPYDITKWLVKLYGMTYYFVILSAFGLLCLIVLPFGILSLIFVSFSIVLCFLAFHFLLWYFDCVLTHAMRFLFLYSNSIPLQKEMETYYLYTNHAPTVFFRARSHCCCLQSYSSTPDLTPFAGCLQSCCCLQITKTFFFLRGGWKR